MNRVNILGCTFDRLNFNEVVGKCEEFINSKSKELSNHIIVMNAALMLQLRENGELREALDRAAIVAPDGMPLVWTSKLLRKPLPTRVNGTDLMEKLVEISAKRGYRIYFLGATEEIVSKTISVFKEKYPLLNVVGWHHGYFSEDDEQSIIRDIKESNADILFIGISSPFKEIWVSRNLEKLNVPVCHGVGGSFDVVAGKVKRAPLWMQNYGLEWLFRLIQEPRRLWKRYIIGNAIFSYLVIQEFIRGMIDNLFIRNSKVTSK